MDKECAGLVLAAGASSRMGHPKALLRCSDGQFLLAQQACLLEQAGCDPVHAVVGSDSNQIMTACSQIRFAVNANWPRGRVSSVQAGLESLWPFAGCILLPVDTVGIKESTLRTLLGAVDDTVLSIRPFCDGKRGKVCWISGRLYEHVQALAAVEEGDARLDALLRPSEMRIDVNDAAVLNNMNTPRDWQAWVMSESSE